MESRPETLELKGKLDTIMVNGPEDGFWAGMPWIGGRSRATYGGYGSGSSRRARQGTRGP